MKVSVVIPTFNSSATIRMTLESVLQQTVPPDEILVMDDGSTDDTVSILRLYAPRITVFEQKNRGVAGARNELCARARGELIAFLDHDDLWHPSYLDAQTRLFDANPGAVGFFAGHIDFSGYGTYKWTNAEKDLLSEAKVFDGLSFFKAFTTNDGLFASASFFCIPRRVLGEIGGKPFAEEVSGVDDAYLKGLLSLLGSVIYLPTSLVAYRFIRSGQSTDKLKAYGQCVTVFELLENRYKSAAADILSVFEIAFASARRSYSKMLMGAGRVQEAREQLKQSLENSSNAISTAKSLGLLALSYLPSALQPDWPKAERVVEMPEGAQRA